MFKCAPLQIAARTLLSQKEYGAAVAYCTSAEDWPGLGRIVDCVLEEYFTQGAVFKHSFIQFISNICSPFLGPADFARLVANIAPSLQTLRAQQESITSGVFVYRLMFAVRLAEFHQRRLNGELHEAAFDVVSMLRDDIAPKAWWAVVLFDAIELLQDGQSLFISGVCCILVLTVVRSHRGDVVLAGGRLRAVAQTGRDLFSYLARCRIRLFVRSYSHN